MDDETYVLRRRWSVEEKRAIVTEAFSSGNVIATAKRHGIQAHQIYRWRERFEWRKPVSAFLPVSILPGKEADHPAPVSDQCDEQPVAGAGRNREPRIEVLLARGRRIIVVGRFDVDAVLKLAQGLEGLR